MATLRPGSESLLIIGLRRVVTRDTAALATPTSPADPAYAVSGTTAFVLATSQATNPRIHPSSLAEDPRSNCGVTESLHQSGLMQTCDVVSGTREHAS